MKRSNAFKAALSIAGFAVVSHGPLALAQVAGQPAASQARTPAQPAIPPEQYGVWLQYIASEVRAIRAEMVHLRLAAAESRIESVERELHKVRLKQSELQAEETQFQQQVSETNALAQQQLDPDQRAQVEAVRTELAAAGGGDRLETQRRAAAASEAQLLERLQREKLQQERLQAIWKQMTNGAAAQ